MRVTVLGFPNSSDLEAECLDLVRLWTEDGFTVNIVVAGVAPLALQHKLAGIGCEILCVNDWRELIGANLGDVAVGLYDQTVIGLGECLKSTRSIWVGDASVEPIIPGRSDLFDVYVAKGIYHQRMLLAGLFELQGDFERVVKIRPPYYMADCPASRPHDPGSAFAVGRLGCVSDERYYAASGWGVLTKLMTPVEILVSEWSNDLGSVPHGVRTFSTYEPASFFPMVHCLLHISSRKENWLRYALDAMAAGVPVVAQNDGSWREIIRHGENGFICNTPDEAADVIDILAQDESYRHEIIRCARLTLGRLINNDLIAFEWRKILSG